MRSRLEVIPLGYVGRVRVIVENPNHPKARASRGYWCPPERGLVSFGEISHCSSKYERHGQLDEQEHPPQHFEDAMAVQPRGFMRVMRDLPTIEPQSGSLLTSMRNLRKLESQ